MPLVSFPTDGARATWFRFLPVLVVLCLSLATTFAAWRGANADHTRAITAQFRIEAEALQRDIEQRMQSYGQALRSGVGLFHATESVSRDQWRRFVSEKQFEQTSPGIQGLSYNAIVRGPAERATFEEQGRAIIGSGFAIRPAGDRPFYVPVKYLEPLTDQNKKALGFDIYSEPNRRAAIENAFRTAEISMTAPITLVQNESNDVQAGVLVVLPSYATKDRPNTPSERRAQAEGLVVSVFRIGDLLETVLNAQNAELLGQASIYLMDTTGETPSSLMFHSVDEAASGSSALSQSQDINLFGRTWTLLLSLSSQALSVNRAAYADVLAWMGIAMSVLLAGLTWLSVQRIQANAAAAKSAQAYSSHVQSLMQEVNHRSKNLLALVRAIARLTASEDPQKFNVEFSRRIEGLAASQDLLVRSNWKGTNMVDLVVAQLSHFEGLIGDRILIEGPSFQLRSNAAQSIGMALHEMATNAGKYGALSNDTGQISITWSVEQNESGVPSLVINWIETGGPTVIATTQRGFGTAVIGKMAEHGLNAKTDSRFEPEGFSWQFSCPVDSAQEGDVPKRAKPY